MNLSSSDQSNKSTQLIKVTEGMRANYNYLKDIGPSIANFGEPQDEKIYTRALQHQIETELLQLQMDLGKGYSEMRRTQFITLQLYYRIVDAGIKTLEYEMIRLTKLSNNRTKTNTHFYLKLGFREIAVAKMKILLAKNKHPQLYLLKLQDASYALQSLKQCEKYIIRLGLLHDGSYESEEDELESFEALKLEIQRVIPNDTDRYLRYHYDSYFTVYDRRDIFYEVWNDPKLEELAIPLEGVDEAYIRKESYPDIPRQVSNSN
ncbi:adhesin OmpL37 family surface protein [Leptospira sp. GIMC2001]|uniref:adhesin OmpL37 family surface protein n=1 Tax=Leptospira sp. GIMC2001 TaxID=1513297 RepID=UPI00234AD00A|nr:hypothetical protein [Leptospira sp. GIMC2001]WCL49427.1 hypothetical protein O4O04_19385 [Leptospira sp. GIMC2001]